MRSPYALALVSAVILALCSLAEAQPYNRAWVSAAGTDNSSCGLPTSPCASFAGALANTNPNGEINCLTPGDFEIVTISKSVSIVCDGVSSGGILTSTVTNAITINAPSGSVVYLSGLDVNGFGGTGNYGVFVNSGSTVYINHSTIRGFALSGVAVNSTTNSTRVIVKDSTIAHNQVGVNLAGVSGATNAAIIENTLIDANSVYAVQANGQSGPSVIVLQQSKLFDSPTALNLINGASAELLGPSNIIGGTINGPTTNVPFQ